MLIRIALLLLVVLTLACSTADKADVILSNGKVLTVDKSFSIAEAIALKGDRILAVGTNDEIAGLAHAETETIDLDGKTVLPGLIDSHVHALGSAMYEFDHEVPSMETMADVLAYVKSRTEALEDGEWIYVSQVFITRLRDQRYPTRAELDKAAPKNPVVFRTGPDASLNSLALELSGIDRNFKVDDGKPGRIERDSAGNPTGILRQCSRFIKYDPPTKQPTDADRLERLQALFEDYNAVGITSIGEGNTSDSQLELLRQLKENDQLSVRVFSYLAVDAQTPIEEIRERLQGAAASPLHTYNNMLWLRGAKVFLDGGMLTGSAFMRQPWGVSKIYSITDPEYAGMRYIEPDKFYEIMKSATENEIQLTAHSVGDGAVHTFVEAAEKLAADGLPINEARPCLTHSNFMSVEAVEKMAKLGVVANMQPNWLQLDGATLMKHFGEDRTEYFQPYRTIFDKGVIVGGGSDHMQKIGSFRSINQYNPFLGMWTAIARKPRWMDTTFHPEQRITREEAIRLYTINNAYLSFEENEKGSLEAGKLADLIVLDRDILECPEDDIPNIKVLLTYLGGDLVHQAQ
jgi:predicted amidohydrolase YtcJ